MKATNVQNCTTTHNKVYIFTFSFFAKILTDSKLFQKSRDWEVMDSLQHSDVLKPGSSQDLSIPGICEGYLMKRRKYPLKGWHRVSAESSHAV